MAECAHLDQVRVTRLSESWCFVDEIGMVIPEVVGETRIPPSPLGG